MHEDNAGARTQIHFSWKNEVFTPSGEILRTGMKQEGLAHLLVRIQKKGPKSVGPVVTIIGRYCFWGKRKQFVKE